MRHALGAPCVEIFESNLFTDRKALDDIDFDTYSV